MYMHHTDLKEKSPSAQCIIYMYMYCMYISNKRALYMYMYMCIVYIRMLAVHTMHACHVLALLVYVRGFSTVVTD